MPLSISRAGKHASQLEAFRRVTEVIVPLTDNESGPAFYCVHPLGGIASGYVELASLLGPDIRFFGIQVPTRMRTPEFPASIESMAGHYVDALMRAQTEGPILLGGWSVGATVALEMAQQLTAAGRKVSLLVAIDKAPENVAAGISRINPLYYAKLMANIPDWVSSTWRDPVRLRSLIDRLTPEKAAPRHPIANFVDVSNYSSSHVAFMESFYNAAFRYDAKQYSGEVVVYEAKSVPLHHLPQVGAIWKKLAPRTEVVRLKGSHLSIVNAPDAIPLAHDLRERILSAASKSAASKPG